MPEGLLHTRTGAPRASAFLSQDEAAPKDPMAWRFEQGLWPHPVLPRAPRPTLVSFSTVPESAPSHQATAEPVSFNATVEAAAHEAHHAQEHQMEALENADTSNPTLLEAKILLLASGPITLLTTGLCVA